VAGNLLLHDTEQFRQKAAAGQRNDGAAGAAPGQFGRVSIQSGGDMVAGNSPVGRWIARKGF